MFKEKFDNDSTIKTTLLSDEGFKGTVANRAVLSLHGGPLKITLTVPLNKYI